MTQIGVMAKRGEEPMPWTVDNPPNVAKNWSDSRKKKCVSAANAVLKDGGTDEEAIFACIHASERSRMNEIVRKAVDKVLGRSDRGLTLNEAFTQMMGLIREKDEYAWLNDLYFEDDGSVSAIISSEGKLFRAGMVVLDGVPTMSEWQEVQVVFQPRARPFSIIRQADGKFRWFAIAETAVLLRVGEIDSTELFDDFIVNAEENGYPVLRFFHDDRMEFGDADWMAREDKCLLMSGTFRDHPLSDALIESVNRGDTWGTSVGFMSLDKPEMWEVSAGVTVPVNKRGICRELSVLPENRAASWFTNISTEVTRMRPEVSEAIVRLFGDKEKAEAYMNVVDETNRQIYESALVTREGSEEVKEDQTEYVETVEAKVDESLPQPELLEVAEAVDYSVPIAELRAALADLDQKISTSFEALNERIREIDKPIEERLREMSDDMPERSSDVAYRPRQNNSTKPNYANMADATLAAFEN